MRQRLIGVVIAVLLLNSGCWDRLEVNDLAIVTLAGIDAAEEGLRLTVSIVVPTGGKRMAGGGSQGDGDAPVALFSATGQSIMDAMMKIQEKVSRRLFWAHTRALIFSEEFARQGLKPALDFWSRHREPRMTMRVLVTPHQALDVITVQPEMERLLSEALRETIHMAVQSRVNLGDFLAMLRAPGAHPIAPRVLLTTAVTGQRAVAIDGTAVFEGDQLVGWLDDKETRGLLWLRNEVNTGVVTMDVPGKGKVSVQVLRAKTIVRPAFQAGQLRLEAHMTADAAAYEANAALDLGKAETLRMLEEHLSRAILHRSQVVLEKVQKELKIDVVRFCDAVRRGTPLLWEGGLKDRWEQTFPRVPVRLTVTAHIRRSGEHGAPLGLNAGGK